MKTAISIPEEVFREAELLAKRLGVSRSELYSKAIATLVATQRDDSITLRLNEIYGQDGEDSSLDSELAAIQRQSLASRRHR